MKDGPVIVREIAKRFVVQQIGNYPDWNHSFYLYDNITKNEIRFDLEASPLLTAKGKIVDPSSRGFINKLQNFVDGFSLDQIEEIYFRRGWG